MEFAGDKDAKVKATFPFQVDRKTHWRFLQVEVSRGVQ